MAQYDNCAQPQPKDKNEYVAHQFHVNAHFDAKLMQVTLTVNDAITKKTWEKCLTKIDFDNGDVKGNYDKMKVAVDTSKMACAFPDEGKPMDLVLMTHPDYMNFELPEK
mmetsp:Transcript_14685/g.13182  ORF Transcript_14685/g.13182 Transcript_14685/m.13182 type:complete len:109 (+) Transcript_14685:32-358(+)|eukprot:CAMPEP_0201564156 /NCGR_PEP_ID=MMETSP0190_2-20130828/2187_1 /ASSEMBLY_ACC=CAM_ASM_000263 /TAXON_ID=37353 /ORGANISM="Rosalina sp." /LENGTH=108 /DNA_ID=CAMNT_0047979939 /DNA_START=23 /DNA_END=349 /DNA_ORIENTATION=+